MRKILKNQRIKNNYTQQSIADFLGINRSTYTRIELGQRNPSFNLALKIKQVLNWEKDDIFLNVMCLNETSNKTEQS